MDSVINFSKTQNQYYFGLFVYDLMVGVDIHKLGMILRLANKSVDRPRTTKI